MATALTDVQVAAVAYEAGFRGNDLVQAVARAKVESSDVPSVRNSIGASGLWQILQSAHPEFAKDWANGDWTNPLRNAQMAFQVWQAAGGWGPWSSEGTAWQANIPAAQTAVSQLSASGFDTTTLLASSAATDGATASGSTDTATTTNPTTATNVGLLTSWVQPLIEFFVEAGMVIGGVALIFFGLRLVLGEL